MILNHLNLTVPDALETGRFLQKYFGLRPAEGAKESASFAVLFDDQSFVLTLIRAKRGAEVKYPETFHIGFGQPDEERVNEIHRRLKEDGFDPDLPQRLHAWTFYVRAPGGVLVSVP